MKATIIGGSGLIGQALAKELESHQHDVTILTRKNIETHIGGYHLRHWDGKTASDLALILEGQDSVINLAGESIGKGPWTAARKKLLLQSRVEPTLALVEALRQCKQSPKLLIQASAVGVYGTGSHECFESSQPGNDFLSHLAVEWENASAGTEVQNIRRVIVRTGVVLAKQGGVLAQIALPFKLFIGGPIGSGKQWISWIHLQDEVRAIRFLLERSDALGVYNLVAPHPVTNAQMGKTLAKVLHRPYWLPLPGFLLKLVLGEMSTLILDGQRVIPKKLVEAGFTFNFPELEDAVRDLFS